MNQTDNRQRSAAEKLPFRVKLAYGLSGYTSFITWTLFSLYGLYFFTDVVGFTAAFAGGIISVGTLWDAVTDPIIGSISDNHRGKNGRRRPFIIGIAIPFAFVSILLFTNFGFDEAVSKVYFVIIILCYYTCQTVLDISSSALGSEMTLDYDERSSLATYKNFFCMAVVIIVSPTLMLTGFFEKRFAGFGWSCTLAVYMIIALVCIFALWKTTEGYERYADAEEGGRFTARDVKELLKNKPARVVMIIFGLGVFENSINLALQVYYYTYYMQMTAGQIASVTTFMGIFSCFAAIGVDVLCKKLSKKMAWIIAAGLQGISMVVLIALLIQPGQVALVYLLTLLMGLGVAAVYQIPWSMIPDCVDVNELATGKRTDGIIFGIIAFIQKVCGAAAIALSGTMLTLIGYNAAGPQTAETLFSMKLIYGLGCGALLIVTVVVVLFYPLSKERHDRVLEAIAAQKAGGEVDMAEFADLI